MLSLESQRVFQNLLLFCDKANYLVPSPEGNSELCFLRISMFAVWESRETLRFETGNLSPVKSMHRICLASQLS